MLIHHYRVDENGLIAVGRTSIIATGHNNLAMNHGVLAGGAALRARQQGRPEGMLNRVEAVIRCFDPCLSCSTHAIGQMPMQVEIRAADGSLVRKVQR